MMSDKEMLARMTSGAGFIAALDQSGGSTPGALRAYGVADDQYSGDAEMFAAMHAMRVRIMTAPSFTGEKVLGAILFEGTMDAEVEGVPTPTYLWRERKVVPFVKVDKGLEKESDKVQMMKPMPQLGALCDRAAGLGVFGTKMRSVIHGASESGIAAIVAQQFEAGAEIDRHGLMPILEPEVSIKAPDKAAAETILAAEIGKKLDALPAGKQVMLKLTIPDQANLYAPLIAHKAVARVVALSGGYTRADACRKLAENKGMIASFSRALIDELRFSMSDAEFDAVLGRSIDEIYQASLT